MINQVFIEPGVDQFVEISARPQVDQGDLTSLVADVFRRVTVEGDSAVLDYTKKFDGATLTSQVVTKEEMKAASRAVPVVLKDAIRVAKRNVEKFHLAQVPPTVDVETMNGVRCTQRSVGIERVGLYIPGGSAPLFSTVLMLAIPAQIAGCKEIVLCTPPDKDGKINPAILFAADLCGVTQIFKIGGAQAIAAMSCGTGEVPKVSKVFGPGNQYVTAAKMYAQKFGVAMDMPAGPSELLVYADGSANPVFVASDLLSQAEHGADSQVILVCKSKDFADQVNEAVNRQIQDLPRKDIAIRALSNSKTVILKDVEQAFDFINLYAPEHFIIASDSPNQYIGLIINAGSVFMGNYTPESVGDYASGTNHTLPTNGWATTYSGVNVDSFSKKITFQSLSKDGLRRLGSTVITMAEHEELQAHANAVKVRLQELEISAVERKEAIVYTNTDIVWSH